MFWVFALPGLFVLLLLHERWDKAMEAKYGEAFTEPRDRILGRFLRIFTWVLVLAVIGSGIAMCVMHERQSDSDGGYQASETDRD